MPDTPPPRTQRLIDEATGQPVHLVYAIPPELLTGSADPADDGIDLRSLLARLWAGRWLIAGTTCAGAILGLIIAFSLPVKYQSQVVALPPPAKGGGGGFAQYADLAAMAGVAIPAASGGSVEEIMAILDSRTLRQKLIADFNLKAEYGSSTDDAALLTFAKDFTARHDKKTNRITISFLHGDAQKAADLCNAAAAALQARFNEIHQSSSRRERQFLESRLALAEQEAAKASEALAAFQRDNHAVELEAQTKATVEAIGTLQGQLIGEQIELRALLASAVNPDNPQVQLLQQKVEELAKAMAKLTGAGDQDGVLIGLGRVPELGVRYLTLFRNVKRGEAMVATLMGQTESARVAEVRDAEVITIIDNAEKSALKFWPKFKEVAGLAAVISTFAAILFLSLKK